MKSSTELPFWIQLKPKERLILITDWMACLASGLSALHKKKIKHQDMKPENVLLDTDLLPIICDFGLSKAFEDKSKSVKFQGTRAYLPPEQLSGEVGRKGDIFSLGLVFVELGLFFFGTKALKHLVPSGFYMDITNNLDDFLELNFPFVGKPVSDCWIQSFRVLLKSMLQNLPENRPKAPEVWEKLIDMVDFLGATAHCFRVSPVDSISFEHDDEEDDFEIRLNENNFKMMTE
jgi:serine/threonine protein kinase